MLLCANVPVLSQSLLEELASKESQLHRLKEKAQQLWDGHTAGKGFVHRVSQLSAQYLALSNLTKVTSCLSACWLPVPNAARVIKLCVHRARNLKNALIRQKIKVEWHQNMSLSSVYVMFWHQIVFDWNS